ncbi:hypothetical protein F5Y15DRAFT_360889 [Xylariaceae sp. FL0016]|nr:hypothetical protein F5Y15DRAFT_360889 [Xylariaceae sp. FL0016]
MYAGNYGFPNNAAASQYNGAPPSAPQNSSMQQPGNPIMYNNQPFPMAAQGPTGAGPGPGAAFPGNPNMMPGAGPAAMMQNTGMPHMAAANGQIPNYQTPYTNSPYGGGIPTSVAPQMNVPPNYQMGGGMPMPSFPMQQQGMNPQQQQQMMQRMQASQQNPGSISTPTPQRHISGQTPHGTPTPNNAQPSQPSQFPTPQISQGTPHTQASNHAQVQSQQPPASNSIQTPQTPTFPTSISGSLVNGSSSASTPLSPGAESKEKEKVGAILEINNELLCEAMQIQVTQQFLKKERTNANGTENASEAEKKSAEDEKLLAEEYVQFMRRISTNLSYLAALADRKGNAPMQQCPAYLRPPPLNTNIKLRHQGPDGAEIQSETSDRAETAKYIGELYKKLQGLYPGIDPTKEPAFPGTTGRAGGQTAKPGSQTPGQASPVPGKQTTPTLSAMGPSQVGANLSAP